MIVNNVAATERKINGFSTGKTVGRLPSESQNNRNGYDALFYGRGNGIARDYLRFAIQRAVEAAESYRNAAEMVSGDRQDLLYYMAGQKNKQAISLKINDPESGTSILESKTNEKHGSISSYFLDVEFKPLDSLDEVFLFIFKSEQKNLDIYSKLAGLERDPEVRTLFLYLIQLQTEDIFRLENEFTKLSKKEDTDAGFGMAREMMYDRKVG